MGVALIINTKSALCLRVKVKEEVVVLLGAGKEAGLKEREVQVHDVQTVYYLHFTY